MAYFDEKSNRPCLAKIWRKQHEKKGPRRAPEFTACATKEKRKRGRRMILCKLEFQGQSWCHHDFDVAFWHFIRYRSIYAILSIAKKLFETRIVNTDDGKLTIFRNSLRGFLDSREHRVGTIRIRLDFDRIFIVHNVEPRTACKAWQSVLLLFKPKSALAFLCVKFHWCIAHGG